MPVSKIYLPLKLHFDACDQRGNLLQRFGHDEKAAATAAANAVGGFVRPARIDAKGALVDVKPKYKRESKLTPSTKT
jgi:hypothetical protein